MIARIPHTEYIIRDGSIPCVTFDLVRKYHSESESRNFSEWMNGQTVASLKDGRIGIYVHDYERWLAEGKLKDQCSETWD